MRQPDLEYKTLSRMKTNWEGDSCCINGDNYPYTRPNYKRKRSALYLQREPIRLSVVVEQTQLRPTPLHYHAGPYGVTLEL